MNPMQSTPEDLRRTVPMHYAAKRRADLDALMHRMKAHHQGKTNAIPPEELALELCMSLRTLLPLVHEARALGLPISCTPDVGYYVAKTSDEIDESCSFLRERALNSLRMEAQMRRVPLSDLLSDLLAQSRN
jgi:hypothetical protein